MNTKKITTQLKNKNMSDNQSKPQAQGLSRSLTQEEENQNKEQSNTEIVKRIPLKKTPFTFIHSENRGFIALGNYRLSEEHKTENTESLNDDEMEELGMDILIDDMWNILLNMNILCISIENKRQADLKKNN